MTNPAFVTAQRCAFAVGAAVVSLVLSAAPAWACDRDTIRNTASYAAVNEATVLAFYETAGGCVWSPSGAELLRAAFEGAREHGLDPSLFHADAFTDGATGGPERDVLLTDGALKYAAALSRGLSAVPPRDDERAAYSRPDGELIDGLLGAAESGDVSSWFESLAPSTSAYAQLKAAFATYHAIVGAGGFEPLPPSVANKRRGRFIPPVRRRLALEGDLSFDDGSAVFDDGLREALVRFQTRNGLRADGRLTAKTVERLNVSASQRVAQLALNLERLRLADRELPGTRVEVNAPAATAILYRNGAAHLAMNAVVGAPGHDTPTLRSTIETIVINPPWNIPRSIIENEIKPAIRRNKNYLAQNRMYWAGDQLIQEPGPHNALGRIKFDFPNKYSVYLHDTPARRLFLDPERAQSHGCVRLEKPLELATELLQANGDWDREAIAQAIREGATRRITLSEPVTVVISYNTAFVGEDGLVHFRPDIYGLDTQLTLALAERAGTMRRETAQW